MCRNFLLRKYDVISQLRHSYAKGPFCVARLMSCIQLRPIMIFCWNRNCATQTIQQELLFVGQENGKMVAVRDMVRKVSGDNDRNRNCSTQTIQQESPFVGQENGKMVAVRDMVRKVSGDDDRNRNCSTQTIQQELLFVGQEKGKMVAVRDMVRKVSGDNDSR